MFFEDFVVGQTFHGVRRGANVALVGIISGAARAARNSMQGPVDLAILIARRQDERRIETTQ